MNRSLHEGGLWMILGFRVYGPLIHDNWIYLAITKLQHLTHGWICIPSFVVDYVRNVLNKID